jgi:HAD superfamily hydrolase (TIGR01509 family)
MLLKDCQAVIFDMDGVLVDTENLYKVIEQELFAKIGIHIFPEEHVSYQGCSNPVMWAMIKEKHGLHQTLDELVTMTEEKVINFFLSQTTIPPMTGVVELLQYLRNRGIKLALASSSTIEVIRIILAKSGLGPYFEVVVDSNEAGAGKPDPAIFLLAQKKLGVPKENCVVIEDSFNGIRASLAAEIYCIAFSGPGSEHQDQSAANLRISRFSEIRELMELKSDSLNS